MWQRKKIEDREKIIEDPNENKYKIRPILWHQVEMYLLSKSDLYGIPINTWDIRNNYIIKNGT